MRTARFALYALLNITIGVLVVVAISIGPGSAPDLRDLEDLTGRLTARFGLASLEAGFRSGPRPGDVSLAVRFTAPEDVYTDRKRLDRLVDQIHRRAVLDYRGYPAGVYVEASAPGELLLVGLESDYVTYRSLQEMLDSIHGEDLIAYGNARWGVPAGVPLSPRWRQVVIHHSATMAGSAESFDRYHREYKHWAGGLGYHFVIGNGRPVQDGLVEVGRRWRDQSDGAHAGVTEVNHTGVGICLVGNFDEGHPTQRQMASLRALIRWLHLACGIPYSEVKGHRDVKLTECPGANFPMAELLQWLEAEENVRRGL